MEEQAHEDISLLHFFNLLKNSRDKTEISISDLEKHLNNSPETIKRDIENYGCIHNFLLTHNDIFTIVKDKVVLASDVNVNSSSGNTEGSSLLVNLLIKELTQINSLTLFNILNLKSELPLAENEKLGKGVKGLLKFFEENYLLFRVSRNKQVYLRSTCEKKLLEKIVKAFSHHKMLLEELNKYLQQYFTEVEKEQIGLLSGNLRNFITDNYNVFYLDKDTVCLRNVLTKNEPFSTDLKTSVSNSKYYGHGKIIELWKNFGLILRKDDFVYFDTNAIKQNDDFNLGNVFEIGDEVHYEAINCSYFIRDGNEKSYNAKFQAISISSCNSKSPLNCHDEIENIDLKNIEISPRNSIQSFHSIESRKPITINNFSGNVLILSHLYGIIQTGNSFCDNILFSSNICFYNQEKISNLFNVLKDNDVVHFDAICTTHEKSFKWQAIIVWIGEKPQHNNSKLSFSLDSPKFLRRISSPKVTNDSLIDLFDSSYEMTKSQYPYFDLSSRVSLQESHSGYCSLSHHSAAEDLLGISYPNTTSDPSLKSFYYNGSDEYLENFSKSALKDSSSSNLDSENYNDFFIDAECQTLSTGDILSFKFSH